jgi:hypothetical protein
VSVLSDKCLTRPIVTRAHVPRRANLLDAEETAVAVGGAVAFAPTLPPLATHALRPAEREPNPAPRPVLGVDVKVTSVISRRPLPCVFHQ